jgi:hypothetical protein
VPIFVPVPVPLITLYPCIPVPLFILFNKRIVEEVLPVDVGQRWPNHVISGVLSSLVLLFLRSRLFFITSLQKICISAALVCRVDLRCAQVIPRPVPSVWYQSGFSL